MTSIDLERQRQAVRSSSRKAGGRPEKRTPKTLREIRHEHGITLTEAAELAELNTARVSELERGVRWPSRTELEEPGRIYGLRLRVGFAIVEELPS